MVAATLACSTAACAVDPVTNAINGGSGRHTGNALLHVADASAAAGDYAAAAGYYRRAHALEPRSLAPLLGLGRSLTKLGDNERASEAFEVALKLDGRNIEALYGLGNALIGLNRPQLAIGRFETALSLKENARAYNGLGVAYDMLGDHTTAQIFYGTGLKLEPANLTLRNNLGLSLAIDGKFDQAIKILRQAAADPRATSRNRLNLALAYGLAGQPDKAAEIARIDLDDDAVRRNLAYYRTLRALKDTKSTFEAIGVHGFVAAEPGMPAN